MSNTPFDEKETYSNKTKSRKEEFNRGNGDDTAHSYSHSYSSPAYNDNDPFNYQSKIDYSYFASTFSYYIVICM
jgi:hypothetical protein